MITLFTITDRERYVIIDKSNGTNEKDVFLSYFFYMEVNLKSLFFIILSALKYQDELLHHIYMLKDYKFSAEKMIISLRNFRHKQHSFIFIQI